jgi:hypothetical protein
VFTQANKMKPEVKLAVPFYRTEHVPLGNAKGVCHVVTHSQHLTMDLIKVYAPINFSDLMEGSLSRRRVLELQIIC